MGTFVDPVVFGGDALPFFGAGSPRWHDRSLPVAAPVVPISEGSSRGIDSYGKNRRMVKISSTVSGLTNNAVNVVRNVDTIVHYPSPGQSFAGMYVLSGVGSIGNFVTAAHSFQEGEDTLAEAEKTQDVYGRYTGHTQRAIGVALGGGGATSLTVNTMGAYQAVHTWGMSSAQAAQALSPEFIAAGSVLGTVSGVMFGGMFVGLGTIATIGLFKGYRLNQELKEIAEQVLIDSGLPWTEADELLTHDLPSMLQEGEKRLNGRGHPTALFLTRLKERLERADRLETALREEFKTVLGEDYDESKDLSALFAKVKEVLKDGETTTCLATELDELEDGIVMWQGAKNFQKHFLSTCSDEVTKEVLSWKGDETFSPKEAKLATELVGKIRQSQLDTKKNQVLLLVLSLFAITLLVLGSWITGGVAPLVFALIWLVLTVVFSALDGIALYKALKNSEVNAFDRNLMIASSVLTVLATGIGIVLTVLSAGVVPSLIVGGVALGCLALQLLVLKRMSHPNEGNEKGASLPDQKKLSKSSV